MLGKGIGSGRGKRIITTHQHITSSQTNTKDYKVFL